MSNIIFVHISTASRAEGDKIARALIEEKLAACVNIVPTVQAIYRWEGEVKETAEVLLIAKTRTALFEPLQKFVKALHSDQCPCIVAMPVTNGHAGYLDWVMTETTK